MTKNEIKTAVRAALAVTVILASQGASAADTLKFTGFTYGSNSVGLNTNLPLSTPIVNPGNAGAYNTTFNGGPTFESFCIDIWQFLSFNTNYSVPTTYSHLSSLVGHTPNANVAAITAGVVGNLSRLYDEASTLGYATATNSAALQLAIWEIVFEGPSLSYDLNSGNFYSGTNTAAKTQAATWLAGLGGYSATRYNVSGYVSDTKQDVIYFTEAPITHQVPEPETYALMLAGLGLMGFVAGRRRKGGVEARA